MFDYIARVNATNINRACATSGEKTHIRFEAWSEKFSDSCFTSDSREHWAQNVVRGYISLVTPTNAFDDASLAKPVGSDPSVSDSLDNCSVATEPT